MATLAIEEEQTGTPEGGTRPGIRATFAELDITLIDDPHQIEAEWRRLEGRDWNSLNQSFEWCRAWAGSRGAELLVVAGRIGRRLFLILPLEIVHEKAGRVARLPGGRFNNVNTGLFDADLAAPDAEEAINFRISLAHMLRGRADLIVFDQTPMEWRGTRHPLAALASVENQNRSFQLPLLGSMEATLSQLNAKTRRKKFRTQCRKLEAIGGFEHVCATDREEQHALLELFFIQKGERLHASGLPDVFGPAPTRAFFSRLLDAPAQEPDALLAMHAIRLKGQHEGHIAAITGLSRKGGHVLCQFSSINDRIGADASPGELLFWLSIERSIEEGATLFDFGIGDQPYKRSWCSQETVQHDILLPVSRRGALLLPALLAATKAKAYAKKHPRLYATLQRWRAAHGD